MYQPKPFEEITDTDWSDIIDLAKSKGIPSTEVEKQFFETARPSSLLRRFATPEEVAALVAFLSSPLSSATNGAALRAEGGLVRSIL
jgi:NAD(P)-dependent dehydrogenase (short-subunit alcohol dehydrogenase family)